MIYEERSDEGQHHDEHERERSRAHEAMTKAKKRRQKRVVIHAHQHSKRGGVIYLAHPKRPNAPKGTCRWCGTKLKGKRASSRRYCYKDREGKDCVASYKRSMTWNPRHALRMQAQAKGETVLRCVDCGFIVERLYPRATWLKERIMTWEADHNTPLHEGGAHTLENLRVRCTADHAAKTARESRKRAQRR